MYVKVILENKQIMPGIALTMSGKMLYNSNWRCYMKKTTSISIRVSVDELELFKKAAELESYSTYTEFIRRTATIEAQKIIKNNTEGDVQSNE